MERRRRHRSRARRVVLLPRASGDGRRRQAGQARRPGLDDELRRAQGGAPDRAAALPRDAARRARPRRRGPGVGVPGCRIGARGAVVVRAAIALVLVAACGPNTLAGETAEAAKRYPDLFHLYAGDQGVYRGCGPSGGVCHNSNEFPNLASLGSIVDNIGRDCNQKRTDPTTLHDLCERPGDRLVAGASASGSAWVEVADPAARTWRIATRDPVTLGAELTVVRGDRTMYRLSDYSATATRDPMNDHAV